MKNKIALIITMAVVGVVVASTILLGVIKVDYSPKINPPYQAIEVKNAEDKGQTFTADLTSPQEDSKNIFNEFLVKYEDSFKQSVLASVFSGNKSNKVDVQYISGRFENQLSGSEGYEIVLDLSKDGENIATTEGQKNDEYKINRISFAVNSQEGFGEFVIYGKIVGVTTGYIKITTTANTKALYDFLSDINF